MQAQPQHIPLPKICQSVQYGGPKVYVICVDSIFFTKHCWRVYSHHLYLLCLIVITRGIKFNFSNFWSPLWALLRLEEIQSCPMWEKQWIARKFAPVDAYNWLYYLVLDLYVVSPTWTEIRIKKPKHRQKTGKTWLMVVKHKWRVKFYVCIFLIFFFSVNSLVSAYWIRCRLKGTSGSHLVWPPFYRRAGGSAAAGHQCLLFTVCWHPQRTEIAQPPRTACFLVTAARWYY